MHSMAMRITPLMQKCPVCGLPFARSCSAKAWGYAYDGKLVCSYHCMKEAERTDNMSEVKLTDEQRKIRNAEILRLHQENMPVKEIAERFSMTVQGVWFVLRNMKKAQAEKPAEISAVVEPAAPVTEPEITEQPDRGAEILRQVEKLKQQMEAQRTLTRAATELMLCWKEKYETAACARKVDEQLAEKESNYFDALRAVAESTREVEKA